MASLLMALMALSAYVCISVCLFHLRYATVAFAGPLNEADVYVVLATKNRHNETLAVCRRECFRARRLPIAEYFRLAGTAKIGGFFIF